ncbi:hypothetical protein C8R43DRAFT_1141715 [Mycena crocata]|nr:hypothetical protein C8R43DRAFT_1141715 [Mycena crocata]
MDPRNETGQRLDYDALLTANMGNDADTVAAVYGGLAGVWYASEEVKAVERTETVEGSLDGEPLFWSPLVHEWNAALVKRDMVEEVAEELALFADRQNAQ